jgi:hypothetical protein
MKAGLLTDPGSGLLDFSMAWFGAVGWTSQLRAQFRICTGFPVRALQATFIRCKNKQN